jgi:hypothetical protein
LLIGGPLDAERALRLPGYRLPAKAHHAPAELLRLNPRQFVVPLRRQKEPITTLDTAAYEQAGDLDPALLVAS